MRLTRKPLLMVCFFERSIIEGQSARLGWTRGWLGLIRKGDLRWRPTAQGHETDNADYQRNYQKEAWKEKAFQGSRRLKNRLDSRGIQIGIATHRRLANRVGLLDLSDSALVGSGIVGRCVITGHTQALPVGRQQLHREGYRVQAGSIRICLIHRFPAWCAASTVHWPFLVNTWANCR